MVSWLIRLLFLCIFATGVWAIVTLSPSSSPLIIGILFVIAAILTMCSLTVHENDPPSMPDTGTVVAPNGKFGSFRWDPSIQEARWFTEDDFVKWTDPDSGEVHLVWPDEIPEEERYLRIRLAETRYYLEPYSAEWETYCEDEIIPESPGWMQRFPHWQQRV